MCVSVHCGVCLCGVYTLRCVCACVCACVCVQPQPGQRRGQGLCAGGGWRARRRPRHLIGGGGVSLWRLWLHSLHYAAIGRRLLRNRPRRQRRREDAALLLRLWSQRRRIERAGRRDERVLEGAEVLRRCCFSSAAAGRGDGG